MAASWFKKSRPSWYYRLLDHAASDPTLQKASERVRREVTRHAAEGDFDAQEISAIVDHDGWQALTKKELKRRGGTLRARVNDQVRRVNAAFSTRKRNAAGLVIGTRVDLFIYKPWDELEELVAEGVAQQHTLEANVIVQKRALALRERCPAARTPAEAAEMLELDIEAYLADQATW